MEKSLRDSIARNLAAWLVGVALLSAAVSAAVTWHFAQPSLVPEERARRAEIYAGIQDLILQSDPVLQQLLALPTSAGIADMEKLDKQIETWGQKMDFFIRPKYGAAQISLLLQPSKDVPAIPPATGYQPDVARRRANAIYALYSVRNNLSKLAERLVAQR